VGALVADLVVEQGISLILDVSHFRKAQRKEFVTAFAEQLFHRKKTARSPMHFFLEEAQFFIPQKVFKGEERMLGAFEDIGKVGRNYGIGLTLISQRPQAVNKDVLNQVEALFVLQMNAAQERKAVRDWIDTQHLDPSIHPQRLRGLNRIHRSFAPGNGECWRRWPGVIPCA
jgi:DNA helicase HerA-like ATPase